MLPARVPDFRPAMLDELIAAGEVLWAASTVGEAHLISFFPTDSPLAPLPVDAQAGVAEASVVEPGELEDPSLDAIVRHVLVAQGPLTFRALTDGAARLTGPVAPTAREVAEALQRLGVAGEGDQRRSGLSPRRRAGRSGIGVRGQRPDALALAAAGEQPAGPVSSQRGPHGGPCGRGGPPGCGDRLRRRPRRALVGPGAERPEFHGASGVSGGIAARPLRSCDARHRAGGRCARRAYDAVPGAQGHGGRGRSGARHVRGGHGAGPVCPARDRGGPARLRPACGCVNARLPRRASRRRPRVPLRRRHFLARRGVGCGGRRPCGRFRRRGRAGRPAARGRWWSSPTACRCSGPRRV